MDHGYLSTTAPTATATASSPTPDYAALGLAIADAVEWLEATEVIPVATAEALATVAAHLSGTSSAALVACARRLGTEPGATPLDTCAGILRALLEKERSK